MTENINQLDELEDLKGTHLEKIEAFLQHRGIPRKEFDGLFALLSQAMNDAYDCADTKDN